MVQSPQRAVPGPKAEVVVHRAARGQVLGDRRPLAARAQDIHEAVHHGAQVYRALVAAPLGRRDQRLHQRPLGVRQVRRVAQLAPVIAAPVLNSPHPQTCPGTSEHT